MAQIFVTTRAGREVAMQSEDGFSLMELIRNHGVDELLALCGGSCSCGTCHVYVDPVQAHLLTPMSGEERGVLEGSSYRTAQSRLSCQIAVSEALDGVRVRVAPEE